MDNGGGLTDVSHVCIRARYTYVLQSTNYGSQQIVN